MRTEDQQLIRRIADYERLASILWIVLGVLQVCMVWTAVAGIWNIVAGFSRRDLPRRIRELDPTIPKAYESITQLVILGVVNLVLGAFVGVFFVAFDFYIRDKVLANTHLFDRIAQPSGDAPLPPVPVPVADGLDQQLRALAKLRDDGVITEEDFSRKKQNILGL